MSGLENNDEYRKTGQGSNGQYHSFFGAEFNHFTSWEFVLHEDLTHFSEDQGIHHHFVLLYTILKFLN